MDAIGFGLATAFLVATYATFGLAIHIAGDALGAARSAVTPALLGGFRAWDEERRTRTGTGPLSPDDVGSADGPATSGSRGATPGNRGHGYGVPVTPVRRGGRVLAVPA